LGRPASPVEQLLFASASYWHALCSAPVVFTLFMPFPPQAGIEYEYEGLATTIPPKPKKTRFEEDV
jgi:hypothetical protein